MRFTGAATGTARLPALLHAAIRAGRALHVGEPHAVASLQELAVQGVVPQPFLDKLEYLEWEGRYKDLAYIPDARPEEVLSIDDDEGWVRPDQRGQWIAIAEYDPYLVKGEDREFARVRQLLEAKLQD